MNLTKEQIEIINNNDKEVVITAVAGSGKSSTLKEWAKQRPHLRILYIVFGRAMKEEADHMFKGMSHVHIKTTHSLAFKTYGVRYKNKLTGSYRVVDCARDLGLRNDYENANYIIYLFNQFLQSDNIDIDEFLDRRLSSMKNKGMAQYIHSYTKKLWDLSVDVKSDVKVTHDFYLKLYQMSKYDLGKDYDVILLDEAQDSSMVIKSILESSVSVKHKLIVGDEKQSIFQFRGCVNIMEMFPDATRLKLSNSFRVNQTVADISNALFKTFGKSEMDMKGLNPSQKVFYDTNFRLENIPGKVNIITRRNSTILAHAIEATQRGYWVYFEGGINSYPFQFYKDLFWFRNTNKTTNRELRKFEDWKDLLRYIKESEDQELLSAVNFVNAYSNKLDSLSSAIDMVYEFTTNRREDARFCYCTAHKSKGLTLYDPVFIENDFDPLSKWYDSMELFRMNVALTKNKEAFLDDIEQDLNLLYVAITRAKGDLYINKELYIFSKINKICGIIGE